MIRQCVPILVAAILLVGCDKEPCQPPQKGTGETAALAAECRWTEDAIAIDGSADEAAWKSAQVIDDFLLPWLKEKARPSRTKTSARLLWDRENLYFFAEMEDTDLYARVTEHDGQAWNDDVFELFFKPAADKPGYYEFEINAANTVLDMFLPRRNAGGYERFKSDRPFTMKTAVKLRGTLNKWQDKDTGWSVEGRIPWRDFLATGGRPAVDETWLFALCRGDVSVDGEGVELSTSAPLKSRPVADFHHYEDYAPLKFLGPRGTPAPPVASKRFGLPARIPWNDSRVEGTPDPPLPFTVERAFEKLKIPCPMHVYHEPGTENILLVHQVSAWGGAGRLLRIKDDPNVSEHQELLAPDRIIYGLAFHKDYSKNGFLYVGSNGPLSKPEKTTRVSRFTVGRAPPYAIDPLSEIVLIEWISDGHNGGDLAFGLDGMLYVTSGDGTSDSDTNLAGQDLSKLTAKVLRIDVDRPAPGKNYAIPPDNPFLNQEGVCPETWAYGLRNPWRIAIDRRTGDCWVGNNGQDLWEQVYFIRKGENYGWSIVEGGHPFYPQRKRGPHPIAKPVVDHPHSEARSLTGGQVYYGAQFPELRGMYIYGDWSTGKIWGLKYNGQKIVQHLELASTTLRIVGFGFDSRGELLIADHGGGYYRLARNGRTGLRAGQDGATTGRDAGATRSDAGATPPFPTRLSETGLFVSVKDHKPHPALIPYSVNSPLWSDGAHKERFIALPGADSMIGYTSGRGWDFPDGAVLVKSFALDAVERERGQAASRQWVETRLLHKHRGQWLGYSYRWNDEQSDALLVGKDGADREYMVGPASLPAGAAFPSPPGGEGRVRGAAAASRRQVWHYPSRTECMVCHSRAFNFVLGLSEMQMNREHDYGGGAGNQLRELEALGVLRVNWMEHERGAIVREALDQGKSEKEAGEAAERLCGSRMQRTAPPSTLLPRAPASLKRLADPADARADLNARARSYLHANCAICHVMAGGGNAMMELDFAAAPEKTNLFDAVPRHHAFEIPEARLVAPGSPERSVLLHRMALRGPGQMPPLASSVVDEAAVKLLREWIAKLDTGKIAIPRAKENLEK